jgi:Domain of unknown function (DUF4328)/Protein of unknown function (DUF2510)
VNDDASGYPGAPPGWYADPAGGPGQRWWDGYAWTEATVLPNIPPPPPGSTAPSPYPPLTPAPTGLAAGVDWRGPSASDLVTREVAATPRARIAVIFYGLNLIFGLINLVVNRREFRDLGHQLHRAFHAAQNGQPTPTLQNQSSNPVGLLLGALSIVAIVLALIWQIRAARSARALGFPATHSPGWGVGCWFVPVVNLWMPYQAVRDCLPPGDPGRPLVLRWWLVFLAAYAFSTATALVAFFSSSLALVFAVPTAVLALGLVATAQGVVITISAQHRAALDPGHRA